MKKVLHFLVLVTTFLLLLPSCEKNSEQEITGPVTDGNDPEGTIVLEMNNSSSGNAKIGDGLYIDSNNNFHCSSGMITSYGNVSGLNRVSTIPTSGWVTELKVIPGNGYVYFNKSQYYRIYVVDYRYSMGQAIIGATVKYQSKFYGVDEAIQFEVSQITVSSSGTVDTPNADGTGTVDYLEIPFSNPNIVALASITIEPETATEWLDVKPFTTVKEYQNKTDFLSNGIRIKVSPSKQRENATATVVLKTGYDKISTLAVTRVGKEAYIEFDFNTLVPIEKPGDKVYEIGNHGGEKNIKVVSNVEFSHISYSRNPAQWCTVELTDQQTKANDKYGKDIYEYNLKLTVDANDGAQRNVDVILSSAADQATGTLKINQLGATLKLENEENSEIYASRGKTVFDIPLETSIQNSINVESSVSWCTATCLGKTLRIDIEPTTIDREAKISFPGFDTIVIIHQSKYEEGDAYSEGGIVGVVCYMNGKDRYVRSDIIGEVEWSNEYYKFGSSLSNNDGQKNMEIISAIGGWRDTYPAFAIVADLNINGVTGWYLPSLEEATKFLNVNGQAWTSTEYSSQSAYLSNGRYADKSLKRSVYAIHKFVK